MTDFDLSSLQPSNNPDAKRFEVRVGNDVAMIEYMIGNTNITMTHTEVPPAFEGRGVAGLLAKYALDWAKENGYKVNPLCPFIKAYIQRHPEYQDNAWGF